MRIILKSEVDHLGLPGDVVDVADGYGRNFLLPRGMAIKATPGAMKEAEALTRSRKAVEAKTLGSAQASKEALEARTLRVPARVDDRGSLYGSVGVLEIQRVLKERGHDIPRNRIDMRGTIKEIGVYEVPVHVHPQVTAVIEVEVVDEEGKITLEGVNAPEPAEGDASATAPATATDEPAGGVEDVAAADASSEAATPGNEESASGTDVDEPTES